MRIKVNGETRDVADRTSLSDLVSELQLKPEQVAIEVNREVVRRARWPEVVLAEADVVEIVHFVGGG